MIHTYIKEGENHGMYDTPDDAELLKILHQQNPWWRDMPIPSKKLPEFRREDYSRLVKEMDNDKITCMIGARQVGKTTMMYQLIEKLKRENDPKRVFFLSLDDQYLSISPENFSRIFDLYSSDVLQKPLNELEDRVYMMFDEIQILKNWQGALKRWVDLGYEIKFVISGSSSSDILGGTSESLVGRIRLQTVLPMKFAEYVRLAEPAHGQLLCTAAAGMRGGLKTAVESGMSEAFHASVSDAAAKLAGIKDKLMAHLARYMIHGGYPGIAVMDDNSEKAAEIWNYIHLTIYKDAVRTGRIRDPASLEGLLAVLSRESSQVINRNKISKHLGISRDTLGTYMYILKELFLISESKVYSQSRVVRGRSERKIYVSDIGIRNTICSAFDEHALTDSAEVGKMAETIVADHTRRLKAAIEPAPDPALYYWRGSNEVDMVMDICERPLPVEVKYRRHIGDSDLRGIAEFGERFGPKVSVVVSKSHLEARGSTALVPAWLYLLMC